jgi:hypothetical protein
MAMRATAIGQWRHWVTVQTSGPPQPDGEGGHLLTWSDAGLWAVALEPATTRDLETFKQSTLVQVVSYVVTGAYHAGVTPGAQLLHNGRILQIAAVRVPHELPIVTIALAYEVLP